MTGRIDPGRGPEPRPRATTGDGHGQRSTRIARALPHELLGRRLGITALRGGDLAAQAAIDGGTTPRTRPERFAASEPDAYAALLDAAPGAFARIIGGGPVVDDLFS